MNFYRLPKYVRDQLVLAAALITKRSLFDVSNEDRESIILHITQLLQMEADNAVRGSFFVNGIQSYTFSNYVASSGAGPC